MSITFSIMDEDYNCEDLSTFINLCNVNAMELLQWLGYTPNYCGELDANDLVARCNRRLWNETRNYDPEIPPAVEQLPGRAKLIFNGREENYLRSRTEQLRNLALKAKNRKITYG